MGNRWTGSTGFYDGTSLRSIIAKAHYQLHETTKIIDGYKSKTNSFPKSQHEFERLFESQSSIRDPFSKSTQYFPISQGPNTKLDISIDALTTKSNLDKSAWIDWTYDPTNGTISDVDIWRMDS